nr:unnamed protein product [Digitaria exilis]
MQIHAFLFLIHLEITFSAATASNSSLLPGAALEQHLHHAKPQLELKLRLAAPISPLCCQIDALDDHNHHLQHHSVLSARIANLGSDTMLNWCEF